MAYVLSSRPSMLAIVGAGIAMLNNAAAAAPSTTLVAGPAQVAALGTIQVQSSTIVDSTAWKAKRAAQLASERLSKQRLCCIDGVITSPDYLAQ